MERISNHTITEEEIREGCQKNDRKYQKIFYQKYASKMYAVSLSYAKNTNDAQSILEEGFVNAFEKLVSNIEKGSLEIWIKNIIRNTAIDFYKTKINFDLSSKKLNNKLVEDSAFDKISESNIIKAVNKLPIESKIIFNLFKLEKYSHIKIADKLKITPKTSRFQYLNACNILKRELEILNG